MLISIEGDVGSGKTLLETYIAVTDDRPVFSNYHIKLDRYNELKPETLMKLPTSSLVLMDEAYSWLESRTSGKAANLYFSYVLFQSRKRGLDIIMTNQLIGTVDLRYRSMVNVEIQCEPSEHGFEYTVRKLSRFRQYRPMKWTMPFETAEKIYPLYDSWEPISPIDDDLMFKITKDKTDIMNEVDKHAEKIWNMYPGKSIKKGIVSDYCMREEMPKSYADLIMNRIRVMQLETSI